MTSKAEEALSIDDSNLNRKQALALVDGLLSAVECAASDYYNSAHVLELYDSLNTANAPLTWQIPLDLKSVAVVAALAQAPMALRGDTDRGKTALAERVLTGLFGSQDDDWHRIEVNRGLTVDDLIDVDASKIMTGTVSQAMSAANALCKPARLLDEVNRAHAKVLNVLLHLADGSGLNVRCGDVNLPVGLPYRVGSELKRYAFCIATANPPEDRFAGVFEEDQALTRRIVISLDMDELPPTSTDISKMWACRRAKPAQPVAMSNTQDVIRVYETLPSIVPFSGLGELLAQYFSGLSNCNRSRAGRIQPQLQPGICDNCHLAKASPICGRVGGLGEGLLLHLREVATAIAAVRASLVLRKVRESCSVVDENAPEIGRLKSALATSACGAELFEAYQDRYLQQLSVTGDDVRAAFVLIAPGHVWMDQTWLQEQADCEAKPYHVLRRVAREGLENVVSFLKEHRPLVDRLVDSPILSPDDRELLETFVTTKDAAMRSVINTLRGDELQSRLSDGDYVRNSIQVA